MIRVIGADEMREIDRRAWEELGVPSLTLMENAGHAVATAAWEILHDQTRDASKHKDFPGKFFLRSATHDPSPPIKEFRVVVLCGTGNNGGDGIVAARYLVNWGICVTTLVFGTAERIQGDALVNYEAMLKRGLSIPFIKDAADLQRISDADLIIDGLLGTGARGALTEPLQDIIRAINTTDVPVLSIDLPSGIHTDTGSILGTAVRSDVTITFAAPKPAHVLYPGADCSGQLIIADIGIPTPLINNQPPRGQYIIVANDVAAIIPDRLPDNHKGSFGHAGIIAGSKGMAGAAIIAANACSAAGAGLTTVVIPSNQYEVVASGLREVMTLPLGENADDFDPAMLVDLVQSYSKWNALAVGCGLGRSDATQDFVRVLLEQCTIPTVIDADGLNALRQDAARLLSHNAGNTILTPHPTELARLLGTDTLWVQSNRIEAATTAADEFGTICVLKGASTIIAEPHGRLFFNLTGNSGLAKGGSGDTLTGVIVSLLAQGVEPINAACAGVWLHGRSADFVAPVKAKATMLATDCIEHLTDAYRLLETRRAQKHV